MGKSKTPSFVVTRRMYTTPDDVRFLMRRFRTVNRLYNAGVKHCLAMLAAVRKDRWYQAALHQWFFIKDPDEQKEWADEVWFCAAAYGLSEYALHAWLGKGKVKAYDGSIGINIVQKVGTALWAGVKKALFGNDLHFRKWRDCLSFEDKRSTSGIIYHPGTDTVKAAGREIRLKPVRDGDVYLKEAMQSRIKYCRIVREPYGKGWRFFLQLIMEGCPPKKISSGDRKRSVDPGVSTMTTYGGDDLTFSILSPGIRKYEKAVVRQQNRLSRRIRINNPGCFNENGTFRKGCRIRWTRGMKESAARLRSAFRKQRVYVRQWSGHETNGLANGVGILIVEPLRYKALQKRSAKTEKDTRLSAVKTSFGKTRFIHKFRKKKRFGRSILRHAPKVFLMRLEGKVLGSGGTVLHVDTSKYRASQIDHTTGKATRCGLNDRTKTIHGTLVQRDCYSAFLLYHMLSEEAPDLTACKRDFANFLQLQEELVDRMKRSGDPTGCFGLSDFAARMTTRS